MIKLSEAVWLSKTGKVFRAEVLFRHNGWTVQAFSDETGVREVFWGEHESCNAMIAGSEEHRVCSLCGQEMSIEEENTLRDALHFIRDTLVAKKDLTREEAQAFKDLNGIIRKDCIYGVQQQTFPINKK